MSSRILAVDDNPRNLAILSKLLEPDFDVTTARSGEEALAHGAQRLLALVEKVSLLQRLKAGMADSQMASQDLGQVARAAIEANRGKDDRAKVRLAAKEAEA